MKLEKSAIISALGSTDMDVIVYGTIDSTNLQAKRMLENRGGRKILIAADCQTAGMGRRGKSFYSPSATGLYMTVVTHPDAAASDVVFSTAAAAVAVTRAIEKLTDAKLQIKWVNDIFVGDKKICGILTQAVAKNGKVDSLLTGIGVNISTSAFPAEISGTASSLNCKVDRNRLAAEIAKNVFELLSDTSDRSFMQEYRERSNVIGKDITYYRDNVAHDARATGIDDNGGLIVDENGKKIILTSGEISLRVR